MESFGANFILNSFGILISIQLNKIRENEEKNIWFIWNWLVKLGKNIAKKDYQKKKKKVVQKVKRLSIIRELKRWPRYLRYNY